MNVRLLRWKMEKFNQMRDNKLLCTIKNSALLIIFRESLDKQLSGYVEELYKKGAAHNVFLNSEDGNLYVVITGKHYSSSNFLYNYFY